MQSREQTSDLLRGDLLHVKQAAHLLDCHPITVRRHIHDGTLEAVRLGPNGRLRIRREALEEFLRPVTP